MVAARCELAEPQNRRTAEPQNRRTAESTRDSLNHVQQASVVRVNLVFARLESQDLFPGFLKAFVE